VFVAVDGHIAGAIELHSTVRPEAKQLIQRLRQRGLQVRILSGDQEAPTQRLAQELGADYFSANVLPENKGGMIEQLQTEGRSVCFVGDGINDAIALKKAHVSVSVRGATTVAVDTAQIVLLQPKLDPFIRLVEIATDLDATQRRSFDIVRGLRIALIGGVLLFSFRIYWSLVVMAAGALAGLVNANTPIRKYKIDLEETNKNPEPNGEGKKE
jgi:Cu2+-exporting ATPase